MSDEALVQAHLEGDQEAFPQLVRTYQHALVYLAWSYVKNQEEAEDIAQIAFIKAYEALPASQTDLPFKPWLFQICVNTAKNALKKKKMINFSEIESAEEDASVRMEDLVVSAELTPEEETLLEDRKELVQESLATLPEKFRRVLLLRYMDELSYEEIAQVVLLPLNTVKTHINRAKKLLKMKLHTLL